MKVFSITLFFIILFVTSVFAVEYEGRVVGVSDGDTIKVLTASKEQIKVRFAQIDAPEKNQAFGQKSKQFLSDLIFGKHVKVVQEDKDRYGRIVGRVYLGHQDINAEQVKRGMAWVYVQYASDQSFFDLQKEARNAKRGLWADPNAIPPWEFRHGGKSKPVTEDQQSSGNLQCGSKRYCKEMSTCEEAKFYLLQCGVSSLDRDGDGVPCEALCK